MEQRIELLAGSLLRSGAVRTVEPDTSPTSMHEFESPCRLRYTLEQRYVDTAIHALLLLGKLVVELHSFIGVWQLCRLLLPMLWRCLVLRAELQLLFLECSDELRGSSGFGFEPLFELLGELQRASFVLLLQSTNKSHVQYAVGSIVARYEHGGTSAYTREGACSVLERVCEWLHHQRLECRHRTLCETCSLLLLLLLLGLVENN